MVIANPIYDVVFKYLMEDERIARTILSALLKEDIVHVEIRPQEYSNQQRDTLSVFRIDFAATIREEDGNERLVLIELQKTWLETETLRFRQYLGVHYNNPKNVTGEGKEVHSLPMVAVYILGHKVGDIEEPVLYVKHHAYDYEGHRVTRGLPNPFVESLTHDSIIVQIPRLHGKINNRLDKVLSIFDQSRKRTNTQQELNIDDRLYDGDDEMQHILHRLLMAATDAGTRMNMNVEDEYFSVIESRDTDIMLKNKKIAEQNVQIKEQNAQLQEQNAQLQEQGQQIMEQNAQLQEQGQQIMEQNAQLQEQGQQIMEQNAQLQEQGQQIKEKDTMLRKTIQMLLQAKMTPETIATNLGCTLDLVKQMMEDKNNSFQ